ncbi:FK506-binding protein 2 [Erysiphe neolycopersici]|uniref:peptidylprolyl isomerase n=1 Tax=Erysiphe neolycopersici TaxID=212602 RepID=A0A420HPD1_9PEZI|nr:FK506-binding protein 2 [Erysiphe neolycopersici]
MRAMQRLNLAAGHLHKSSQLHPHFFDKHLNFFSNRILRNTLSKMRLSKLFVICMLTAESALAATGEQVKIQIDKAVECERKSRKGDTIFVHYRGTLQDGGKQFDSSYDRGKPLSFVVGQGRVIKGWDENLIDMCINDKRTLTIPPEFGYGSSAMGPIPASSTLIFETELVGIEGVEAPAPIVASPNESTTKTKVIDNLKEVLASKLAEITKAAKVLLSNSDGDEHEHNEL